jgi:hypothetical protein
MYLVIYNRQRYCSVWSERIGITLQWKLNGQHQLPQSLEPKNIVTSCELKHEVHCLWNLMVVNNILHAHNELRFMYIELTIPTRQCLI